MSIQGNIFKLFSREGLAVINIMFSPMGRMSMFNISFLYGTEPYFVPYTAGLPNTPEEMRELLLDLSFMISDSGMAYDPDFQRKYKGSFVLPGITFTVFEGRSRPKKAKPKAVFHRLAQNLIYWMQDSDKRRQRQKHLIEEAIASGASLEELISSTEIEDKLNIEFPSPFEGINHQE